MNPKQPIFYYKDNVLVEEINPSYDWLQFLYQSWWGGVCRKVLRQRWVACMAGAYKSSCFSKRSIQPFIQTYSIDMSEYQVPDNGYGSFNDFFTRAFKPGARTIDTNPTSIIAPTDGKILVIPDVTTDDVFFIKQKPLNLELFLGDAALAKKYEHGCLVIVRLAPYDYHRFHFPVDGVPTEPKSLGGVFESVNPLAFKSGIQPLVTNQRHIIELKTKDFDTVIMAPVGAMMVGKIVETYKPALPALKGDETGLFAFGGSTVVLLFKHGVMRPKKIFIEHSLQGYETAVKLGESINE